MQTLTLGRGRPRTVDLLDRIRDLEVEATAYATEERKVLAATRTRTGYALVLLAGGNDWAAAHELEGVIHDLDRRVTQLSVVDDDSDPEVA